MKPAPEPAPPVAPAASPSPVPARRGRAHPAPRRVARPLAPRAPAPGCLPFDPRRARAPAVPQGLPQRRQDVAALMPDGRVERFARDAAAAPALDEAFAAFPRGLAVLTADGPAAVEDLEPGTALQTEAGPKVLRWIGATTLPAARLTRIAAHAFGAGRPAHDVVLGPRARLLLRDGGLPALLGTEAAFAPAHALADGDAVAELAPGAPVRVFHLALDGQHALRADGLEVESYHPGALATLAPPATIARLAAFFPHLPGGLDDLGAPALPRLTTHELARLRGD